MESEVDVETDQQEGKGNQEGKNPLGEDLLDEQEKKEGGEQKNDGSEVKATTNGTNGDGRVERDMEEVAEDFRDARKEVEALREEMKNKGVGEIEKLREVRESLETDRRALEKMLEGISDKHLETLEKGTTGVVEEMREDVSEVIADLESEKEEVVTLMEDVLRGASENLAETAEHLEKEGTESYEMMAQDIGELKKLIRDLQREMKAIGKYRRSLYESASRSKKASKSLSEAALGEQIDELGGVVERIVQRANKIEKDSIKRIGDRQNAIVNSLSNERKKMMRAMDSAVERVKDKMSDLEGIEQKVIDYEEKIQEREEKIEEQVKEIVKETKKVTLRQAVMIVAAGAAGGAMGVVIAGFMRWVLLG